MAKIESTEYDEMSEEELRAVRDKMNGDEGRTGEIDEDTEPAFSTDRAVEVR